MKSILRSSIVLLLFLFTSLCTANAAQNKPETIPPFLFNTLNFMYKISGKENLRTNIIDFASQYVGTPYRSGGIKPSGFDCSGFVKYVFSQYGYDLAHSSRSLSTKGETIKKVDAQPGDLVFFAVNGRVHHVAMVHSNVEGDLKIIHSCNSKGVYIESVNDSRYWSSRLYSIKRIL